MPAPKILVVDDEPEICEGLKNYLEFKGFEPRTALSAKGALKTLEDEQMDCILLDYMMPGMNGLEFLKVFRKDDDITPVIIISAHGDLDTMIQANRLGGLVDLIPKPIDWEQLEAAIGRALDSKRLSRRQGLFERLPSSRARFPGFVGDSLPVRNLVDLVEKAADQEATVLIAGETGTGKELVARHLHELSTRGHQPFVSVNCAALNASLLESELFGHEKGAFTGADRRKPGLFEIADGGTLFLDEIGEMPLELQAKLLRVLENGEFRHVGGTQTITSDVRIIAATNRDLRKMSQEKQFREDLYYRLNILTLNTPPLRNRVEDMPELVDYFLNQFQAENRKLTPACLEALKAYEWPGNVRELRNTVERMVILGSPTIGIEDLPPHLTGRAGKGAENLSMGDVPISRVEALHIEDILRRHKGNKAKASRILGITKMTLYKKIREYQLVDFYPRERG